jgi:hypothetical protein
MNKKFTSATFVYHVKSAWSILLSPIRAITSSSFCVGNGDYLTYSTPLLVTLVSSENRSTSHSGFNCFTSLLCFSVITGSWYYGKVDSFLWSLKTADVSITFSKLHIYFPVFLEFLNCWRSIPFKKSSHKHLQTCCCLSPFLSQFPKMGTTWHELLHFWWRKAICTKWRRKDPQQSKFVIVHLTKPFYKLNASNLYVAFPTTWLTSCSVSLHSIASAFVSISYNWLQWPIHL